MIMNKLIAFSIALIINTNSLMAQISSNHDLIVVDTTSSIKDPEFRSFLNQFLPISLPLNYKIEIQRVVNKSLSLKEISAKHAIQFLQKKNEELLSYKEIYNYDADQKTTEQKANLPVSHFKFVSNFILICIRETKGIQEDTSIVSLYTFDFQGKKIDQLSIQEQITAESDWGSFVILNKKQLKIFNYCINYENYTKLNDTYFIKDNNKPLSVVLITDYEITNKGDFKKTKDYPLIYLKDNIEKYKTDNPKSDDPINQYK
jgi:hypothetical protein